MYTIPYRHIHLDFHNSGLIEGLGKDFSKEQFRQALLDGHVDSITLCAKCHHGWMYYPSQKFPSHPHMENNLFGMMLEVAKELNLSVEAYFSIGYDEVIALEHSDWLIRNKEQKLDSTPDFFTPGYHQFCMNTPYLDRVCAQIEEVLNQYKVDGIFLDIVGVRQCYCSSCLLKAKAQGIDSNDPKKMQTLWEKTYLNYIETIKETVKRIQPGIEIFHNSGHINRGRLDLMNVNSHLELESLPTGGWGYDHFLLSSRFVQHFGKPYLGMTGRFHFGWGDFGGYKHPTGIRYEIMRFIANGAGCSIGDQMHPYGKLDPALYQMIGEVYNEVEQKEPWCKNVESVAEIGILSSESAGMYTIQGANDSLAQGRADIGAVRILQESHLLFDVLASSDDFSPYRVIILPDVIRIDEYLKSKLEGYLEGGGKIFATGKSGVIGENHIGKKLGVTWLQTNKYLPNYCEPCFSLEQLKSNSFVMYQGSEEIEISPTDTTIIAYLEEPFFNRSTEHFSSHFHTPSTLTRKSPGMVQTEFGIYAIWNLFSEYALKGNLAAKYIFQVALKKILKKPYVETNYPSQVEISLMEQKAKSRYILHLLHGSRVLKGTRIEIIEDTIPLPASPIILHLNRVITSVYLVPSHEPVPFTQHGDTIDFTIPSFDCHQMICVSYKEMRGNTYEN
jgi:hypothetical protein